MIQNFLDRVVFPDSVLSSVDVVKLVEIDELITRLGKAIEKIPDERCSHIEEWVRSWPALQLPPGAPLSSAPIYPSNMERPEFKGAFIELYDHIAECYLRLEDGGQEPLASEQKVLTILANLIDMMDWEASGLHRWPKTPADDNPPTTWTPGTSAWTEEYNVDMNPTEIIWGEPVSYEEKDTNQ